jgi:transcriptional regulator of aromatic amino acid metabolism
VSVVSELDEPTGMVARSPAMRALIDLAQRVAKVDATVLITGESGTGKERVARLVHDESVRAAGPFIAVNCGAITETLLESELFGHSRGSFTGASQDRPGLFEAANGGTLLQLVAIFEREHLEARVLEQALERQALIVIVFSDCDTEATRARRHVNSITARTSSRSRPRRGPAPRPR